MSTAGVSNRTARWFRRCPGTDRDRPPRRRLLCFPHAGGTANFFRAWPRWLPGDVELLAVQYPGRQDRLAEPCMDRMDVLVAAITAAVRPLLDLPLALFGHSMGAAVAYEVTAALEQSLGVEVYQLFVSGRQPPHRTPFTEVHAHGDQALIADVRRLDESTVELLNHPELLDMVMPAIRADYRLIETYRPEAPQPVRAPIVAYLGEEDPDIQAGAMHDWAELTTSSFAATTFPGDHFYLSARAEDLVGDIASRMGPVQD